ncbi:uncharacterized protein N7496_011081 [Penicillium cataractarum]|uniref:Uncharacterized protein n=1 Tax=Penicillium cataractarum TaxID=2100454 RepID=A0A9W9REA7_9EURO|nr:uncharacterized protein N7496_011081 [Penicillium cataractarum]KAJ5358668.1 hypothetical protein N7496_011081 [Penicillium cataractarum]
MSAKRKSSALSTPAHSAPKRPREQSVAESIAESIAEPGAESVVESGKESLAEPGVESGAESSSESASEPVSQSGSEEEIDIDDLDLNVSYVGKISLPSPPVRPKRKRWTHTGKKPITLMEKVPRGWNDQEPDLDPEDFDAQIARCKERITVDRIMPHVFKRKLDRLEKEKRRRAHLMGNYPGLSWNVVNRIIQLQGVAKHLEGRHQAGREGEYERFQTVLAIKKAYQEGDLDLHEGLVTYWSKGRRLCEPRPYEYAEMMAINGRHGKEGGFWVEEMTIQVRYPGTTSGQGLIFADDTGSDFMTLFDSDMADLNSHYRNNGVNVVSPSKLRTIPVKTFSGNEEWHDIYEVEVAFADPTGALLTSWDRLKVLVLGDPIGGPTPDRVNGPWIRYKLHTSTAPTARVDMGIFRIKSALAQGTPVGVLPAWTRVMPP